MTIEACSPTMVFSHCKSDAEAYSRSRTGPPKFRRVPHIDCSTESFDDVKPIIRFNGSPTPEKKDKKVRFADAVGRPLIFVRHISDRDSPPDISSYLASLIQSLGVDRKSGKDLNAAFPQPISDYKLFNSRLHSSKIALESVTILGRRIIGNVKVFNLAYNKTVLLRYTTDRWCTHTDVQSTYVNLSNGLTGATSLTDTFSFNFQVPDSVDSVEFAVCFICNGQQYWDNNGGKNFRFCSDSDDPRDSSSVSQSSWTSNLNDFNRDTNLWSERDAWKPYVGSFPYY